MARATVNFVSESRPSLTFVSKILSAIFLLYVKIKFRMNMFFPHCGMLTLGAVFIGPWRKLPTKKKLQCFRTLFLTSMSLNQGRRF